MSRVNKTRAVKLAALTALVAIGFVPADSVAGGNKVDICHVPPGNPANFHTISVSSNAEAAHLAHGDFAGPCDAVCATLCDDGNACTIDDLGDCEENGCPTQPVQVDCDDTNPCTDDTCNPTTGGCENVAVMDETPCDGDDDRCSGVCLDGACEIEEVADVYFTTDDGVFAYSSDSETFTPLSETGAYSIAVSEDGDLYVGTGGLEATASGLADPGIFYVDATGAHQQVSDQAAEDLQFDPFGKLHFSNTTGIYSLVPDGTASGDIERRTSRATSQFAFWSDDRIVTTNGTAYGSDFNVNTVGVFNLQTGAELQLLGNGGEDIHVRSDGSIEICGQSGLLEVNGSQVVQGFGIFNFDSTSSGTLYVGNTATYGGFNWTQGVYRIDRASGIKTTLDASYDVNALVVDTVCE